MELQIGMENKGYSGDGESIATLDIGDKCEAQAAVVVRNAYKSYGKSTHVLKNFNMTVPEGSIYSLLGSSGCGKTTIFSAIVGIKNLDSGQIRVFGEVPGSPESGIPGNCVGHMPQEYALYNEFSITESFNYYGTIYGMTKDKVKERSEFLIKFLDIPKPSRNVGTLSGGQKRRVSLSIAMLHQPQLLILDEPTVGVDATIRENIWDMLRNLVSNGKTTVIISTHYIEEARNSATIGVMRNGRLLVEKSPSELMQEYQMTFLEDIVLKLSRGDKLDSDEESGGNSAPQQPMQIITLNDKNSSNSNSYKSAEEISKSYRNRNKNNYKKTQQLSFSRFRALVNKNIILLLRNLLFLMFNFLSPALQIVIVCLAIGNEPHNLRLGLVNHENPHDCPSALQFMADYPSVECLPANWSCIFLSALPGSDVMNMLPYENEEEALKDVQSGYLWGYLSFPQNFSTSLHERFVNGLFPSNESLVGSDITMQLDLSSQTIATSLERTFIRSYQKFTKILLTQCGYDTRAGELPLKMNEPVYGSPDTDFREFIAPSILLGLLFFFPLCSAGISYISDRKAGTLDRSYVAGVTNLEVMLSNLLTQSFILFVQAALAFLILIAVFKIHVHGSIFLAVFLSILIGIGGMSMGFLIATFVKEEIQAVLLAIGTFFPNFLLAGMVWPSEGMPIFLQYVGYLLPCTLACESMRSIISRGWGLFHAKVLPGFASTIGWIAIYWILTIFIHRMNRKRN